MWNRKYLDWLNDQFECRTMVLKATGLTYTIVTTPFLYMDNDCIEIIIHETDEGNYVLSDDGEAFSMAIDADIAKHESVDVLLKSNNVTLNSWNCELTCTSSKEDFPRRFHEFLQTLIAIDVIKSIPETIS